MSDRQLPTEAKNFIAARRLIEDKEKWCQDGSGWFDPQRPDQQLCIEGALQKVLGFQSCSSRFDGFDKSYFKYLGTKECEIIELLAAEYFNADAAWVVNDNHGHEATLRLLDLAIDYACVNCCK